MKTKYRQPDIAPIAVMQSGVICASPGTDPGGSGHDFNWGNDPGINPGGSGDDFNWGN